MNAGVLLSCLLVVISLYSKIMVMKSNETAINII